MNLDGVNNIDPTQIKNESFGKQSLGQEDFMRLLLEELAHQDPMNPMDSKEFTVQLTQFSSLEGITNINQNLQNLLDYQQSMQNATVTNMIGKTVKVDGDSVYLNGTADMVYNLADEASSVKVMIYDGTGKMVRAADVGQQAAGDNRFIWDGKDDLGNMLEQGSYTYKIEALDGSGNPIDTTTESSGYVTGVSFKDGLTYLVLDGTRNIYLSEIKSIEE